VIAATLVGDEALLRKLGRLSPELENAAYDSVVRLAIELQRYIKNSKLSGQALKNRTGRLRRSITHRMDVTGNAITGIVGTNVSYAKFHEFGLHGSEHIKEHLRTIKEAFGRPLKGGAKRITVRAHERKVDYAGHPFMRPALEEFRGRFIDGLEAAMRRAVAQAAA
jgi:HK97 gp10 family phage protein